MAKTDVIKAHSTSRKWRPEVIALRAIKNLDSMSLEELVGIHKTHEKELAHDEGTKKRKSLVLMIQRPKHNSTSKELSSKALIVNNALEEESDDNDSEEKDEAPIRHITFEDAPLKQGFIGHIKVI